LLNHKKLALPLLLISLLLLSNKCTDAIQGMRKNGGAKLAANGKIKDMLEQVMGSPRQCLPFLGEDKEEPEVNSKIKYAGGLSPVEGAYKIMAVKFQSCKVLGQAYGLNSDKKINSFMSSLKKSGEHPETDMNSSCGSYTNGGVKYKLGGVIGMKNGTMTGIKNKVDCAAFISAAFAASGLKMSSARSDNEYKRSTHGITGDFKAGNSCLQRPSGASLDEVVVPGDIANIEANHVIMVDKVGKDPFGIKTLLHAVEENKMTKEAALAACKSLDRKDFDLTIIHSSRTRGGDGIHRIHIKDYGGQTGDTITLQARQSCLHFINNGKDSKYTSKPLSGHPGLFLRHKGVTAPGCKLDGGVPKIPGEECVGKCYMNDQSSSFGEQSSSKCPGVQDGVRGGEEPPVENDDLNLPTDGTGGTARET